MRKAIRYFTTLFCCFFSLTMVLHAQTPPALSNPSACQLGLPIDDDTCPEDSPTYKPNTFTIQVTNAPGTLLGIDVYLKEVRLIIAHNWLNDLDISLRSPGGITIDLTSDNGGGESNYGLPGDMDCDSAAIRTNACLSLEDAIPPLLDEAVRPEEHFYHFNDSITNPNGNWQLIICDDVGEDAGTLEFVELIFEPISCLPIQLINDITVDTTTAIVSVTPDNFCGTTIFEYGPPGFTPGTDNNPGPGGEVIVIDGCPPFTLTGLPELSDLDLYVRRYCPSSDSFSGNTCGNSLTTGCLPPPMTIETTFADEENCLTTCGTPCPMTGLWRNAPDSDIDWIVHSGPVATQGTGPQEDANGDGNYVYLESSGSSCAVDSEAKLLSACVIFDRSGSDTCHFSFNYHMYGSSIGQLRLEVTQDGGFSWQSIWEKNGDQGNQWYKEYLSLAHIPDGSQLQFRFVGVKGNGFRGDIALDHLVFYGSVLQGYPDQQFYVDSDGDGYGSGDNYILSCLSSPPAGYTDNNLDCNDGNPNINPGVPESPCNGIDENCNGSEDDIFLPSPVAVGDTICSGETAEICAQGTDGFLIAWFDSPALDNMVGIGPCFSPDLPPNNTPNTVVFTYYVIETNFSCMSEIATEVGIYVRPQPQLVLNGSPAICPGDTFNLAAYNIVDENFTNGLLSFHSISPATPENEITDPLIPALKDSTIYAQMVSGEGCTDEIEVPLMISPGPDLSFSPADSFILCKESSTQVEVIAEGGSGDYQYFWNTGRTSPAITILAGNASGQERIYTVTVTDVNGCYTEEQVVVQTSNSIDSLYRQITNAVSCDGSEGSIALSPLTGLSPFTYQWNSLNGVSGSATSDQDTFVINNLPQGSYRITITDSSSEQCDFLLRNVLVQGPGAAVQTVNIDPVSCGGAADGKISLNVVGNNPVYIWSNGNTTTSIDQLSGGSYSVTITDGPCTTILTDIVVNEPDSLGFRAVNREPTCADAGNGQIALNLFGGDGNYDLEWENGSSSTTLSGLAQGFYALTLTDGNNCSLVDSVLLESPDTLRIQLDSIHHLSCFESADGYLQVSGQGGTPPYQYQWSTGSTIPAVFNLSAGTHTLTLTDFNGCQFIQSIEIEQPELLTAQLLSAVDPLCEGVPNGSISVEAVGGTAPYDFFWIDDVFTPTRSNLPVGRYELIVTDTNGCTSPELVIKLESGVVFSPGISIDPPECVGPATGSISLNPNGVPPYNILWSTGSSTTQISSIPAGEYGLSLTDSRGCRLDSIISLEAPQVFSLDLAITPPTCYQVTDGVVQLLFTETGTAPYTFRWSDGSTNRDRFTLGAGDYRFTVTDALGCNFVSDTINLGQPERFRIEAYDIGQVNCAGESTGFIEVELAGGTTPYDINWVGKGIQSPGIYEIPAGNYRLQVFDQKGCPIDTTFRITQPAPLVATVNVIRGDECDPRNSDTLRASATGGTKPYHYEWSNGSIGPEITNAAPDDYNLTVTDANGCQDIVRSIKVRPREPALVLDTFYVTNISCFGAADATMTAKISGGSGRYTYLFQPARLFENTTEDSITVSGLNLHNSYAVTVTDVSTGCRVASSKLSVSEPAPLSISLDELQEVSCSEGMDGALRVSTIGGTKPYSFNWTNKSGEMISTEEDLVNVIGGVYTLRVNDANACMANFSDSIPSSNEPLLLRDTQIVPIACFGEMSGEINITVSGGQPPYNYQWSNGATTEDLDSLTAGIYDLTLTDADNCRGEFPGLEVHESGSLLESETAITDVACYGGSDGSVRVKINGGTPPYNFDWFRNGQPIANINDAQLNNVPAGTYRLDFSDSQGCSETFEMVVHNPDPLEVNLQITVPNPPDFDDGAASVKVSGGTPAYTYLWSNGDTTPSTTNLIPGGYSMTITDSQGCQDSVRLTITDYQDQQVIQSAHLYPNPSKGSAKLVLVGSERFAPQLVVVDTWGRPVYERPLALANQHELTLPGDAWPPGVYFVLLYYQRQVVYSSRLVILR
ncbi:MAG: MopE-related protein [Saprospiraceae bacterium]